MCSFTLPDIWILQHSENNCFTLWWQIQGEKHFNQLFYTILIIFEPLHGKNLKAYEVSNYHSKFQVEMLTRT